MKKLTAFIISLFIIFTAVSCAYAKTVEDAQYYFKKGMDYEWKNNRLGAIDIYTKALELNPDYDDARIARAKLYYFFAKYEEALSDFNYFYDKPNFGPGIYYEYRIECKKRLGKYSEALDDMYEVILVYGGQAKVLKSMLELVSDHPELEYKLKPVAHPDLIAKYKSKAKNIRDYAVTFNDDKLNIKNPEYYNFFMNIALAMDPDIAQEAYNPSTETSTSPRTAPSSDNAAVIDINY